MAENANQAADQSSNSGAATARPDFFPEKYWVADNPLSADVTGHPAIQNLAKGYAEAQGALGKGKAAFEAERLKGRPEKPDAYTVALPASGAPDGLVLLTEAPPADFQPEAGKTYFQVDAANPLLGWWRQHCYDAGLPQDAFQAGIAAFAKAQGETIPTAEEDRARRVAVYAKLGENGEQRAQHIWGQLKTLVGESGAGALDGFATSAESILALEKLVERAGGPKFAPGGSGAAAGDNDTLLREAEGLMDSRDYYKSTEKQERVAAIYKKVYPGQQQTAVLNSAAAA